MGASSGAPAMFEGLDKDKQMTKPYFILFISIPFQFVAAFLALRLIWITKRTVAWIFPRPLSSWA